MDIYLPWNLYIPTLDEKILQIMMEAYSTFRYMLFSTCISRLFLVSLSGVFSPRPTNKRNTIQLLRGEKG